MQPGQPELYAPERVLVVMASARASQLVAALRQLGSQVCEIAEDQESVQRCCATLQPELVFVDAEALRLAAATRALTHAPFVYVCDAEAQPARELVSLCAAALERPITHARLQRCLSGLAWFSAAEPPLGLLLQREVLASTAHELRAPLQGVHGFARYLLGGVAGPLTDGQATCVQQVELGTQHVLQLVQDTLELTDQNVATREVHNAQLETKQMLLELVQALQPWAAKRGIEISEHSDERVQRVVSDVSKLKQVLLDMISHVLPHAQRGGTLSLIVAPAGEARFCLEVRGTGPGLTKLQLERLNTADATDNISLTQRMVAALGGKLNAFNDQGAVIRLDLPLRPSAERPYLHSV